MGSERILVVEDDPRLGRLLREYLSENGFEVQLEDRGDTAVNTILTWRPALVILDLMLPGLDGFEVFRLVRPLFSGRALFLTARRGDVDHVAGLELGADDYVTKPVDPRVLLARVRAVLRRGEGSSQPLTHLLVGLLEVDRPARRATWEGRQLTLTSAEFDMLWCLALHAGEVVDRDTLSPVVRGVSYDGVDRGLDIHVSRIRRKLRDAGAGADLIKGVRGTGYQLLVEP